jgi:hypothetical protein
LIILILLTVPSALVGRDQGWMVASMVSRRAERMISDLERGPMRPFLGSVSPSVTTTTPPPQQNPANLSVSRLSLAAAPSMTGVLAHDPDRQPRAGTGNSRVLETGMR